MHKAVQNVETEVVERA